MSYTFKLLPQLKKKKGEVSQFRETFSSKSPTKLRPSILGNEAGLL